MAKSMERRSLPSILNPFIPTKSIDYAKDTIGNFPDHVSALVFKNQFSWVAWPSLR